MINRTLEIDLFIRRNVPATKGYSTAAGFTLKIFKLTPLKLQRMGIGNRDGFSKHQTRHSDGNLPGATAKIYLPLSQK